MNEVTIETALHLLNNSLYGEAHEIIKGMDEEEKAHLFNQVYLETEMNYEQFVAQHKEALPADSSIDEI